MAYLFDTDSGTQLQDQQKQNIFSQTQNTLGGQDNGASGSQNDVFQKSSAQGQITPGSSGSSQAPQTREASAPSDQQRTLDAQAAQAKPPETLTNLSGTLDTAKQNLQNEADQYVQGYKTKDYSGGIDQNALSQAETGDQTAFGKVNNLLNQKDYNVDQFAPKTQYQGFGIENLNTRSGLNDLYQKQYAAPNYSANDASYDAMLLARTPGFSQTVNQLTQKQQDLANYEKSLATDTQTQGQTAANQGLTGEQAQLRGLLGNDQGAIQTALQAQADQITQARQGLNQDQIKQKFLSDAITQARQNLESQKLNNPMAQRAENMLGQGFDVSPYVQFGGNVNWQDLADQQNAQKFNNISQLLGSTNLINPGQGAGQDYTADPNSIANAVAASALQQRGTLENQETQSLNAVLSQLSQVAARNNAVRNLGASHYADPIVSQLSQMQGYRPDLLQSAATELDPNQYYQAGTKVDYSNYLDPVTTNKLNQYLADTGSTAGQFLNDGSNQQFFGSPTGDNRADVFNTDAYKQALNQKYQEILAGQNKSSPYPTTIPQAVGQGAQWVWDQNVKNAVGPYNQIKSNVLTNPSQNVLSGGGGGGGSVVNKLSGGRL